MEALTRRAPEPPAVAPLEAAVLDRRPLSAETFELTLSKPPGFRFTAGQRLRVAWSGIERDYSIAGGPAESALRLCIRRVAPGRLSRYLAEAPFGARLAVSGPHGYFTFQPSPRPAVLAATGTGIAPFAAMAAAGVSGFILLHGVARAEDLYYREALEPRAALYMPCLSEGPVPSGAGFAGRLTDYLARRLPAGVYDFYLCGRREMVRDATLLADERFPGSRVFTEIFY